MHAEPIFLALDRMEQALRNAEVEAIRAGRDGNQSLKDWLEDYVDTTRVWLEQWREVVKEANRPKVSASAGIVNLSRVTADSPDENPLQVGIAATGSLPRSSATASGCTTGSP